MKLAALVLAAAALVAGCGGGSSADQNNAKANFRIYAKAEGHRDDAETALNRAFREISSAAGARDRARAMAAVDRGEEAVQTIYSTLAVEIEAANALAGYDAIQGHSAHLRGALQRTRTGTELIQQQLAIARRDPFLDDDGNLNEIGRLSSESVKVAAPAALARRRAVRAIALELGVEPPVDVMFDLPRPTGPSGG